MDDNSRLWLERTEQLLQNRGAVRPYAAEQFATSMMAALYGPESPPIRQFRDGCAAIAKSSTNPQTRVYHLGEHALGAIRNTTEELKAGLIIRVRVVVAGEILAEMIRLAKEIIVERTEEAKNAGAVLVAAAYEGLLRRMGEEIRRCYGSPQCWKG